jgi:tRNA nucleotidyltransferase (CCA-adding enzyme)
MPDYMFLLESRLSAEQRAVLLRVQELAQAQGVNVYLAGGAVRDIISGAPIRDLDFVIEGNPLRLARELEKGGARIVEEDETRRHVELVFHGEVDGSLAAAREDVYERPGAKPEYRWATVTDDLRRRDFAMNAIALSLNPASRGLLLDPTNGLADIERREVRLLSMHGFTNQAVRLVRAIRYCARLDFKLEERTAGWFDLAMERKLHESISADDILSEVRQIGREENPGPILKALAARGLLEIIHPKLGRKAPDYDGYAALAKARDLLMAVNRRPRLIAPTLFYLFGRFSSGERAGILKRIGLRVAEVHALTELESHAEQAIKMLAGRKTAEPRAAFDFLETLAPDVLAFIHAQCRNGKVQSKLRSYLTRWKPLRMSLPAAQLEALGVPRGPKFDQVLDGFFNQQLAGRVRGQEDFERVLRNLAGIKIDKKKLKAEKEKGKLEAKPGKGAPLANAFKGKPAPAMQKKAGGAPWAKAPASSHPPAAAKKATPHTAQKQARKR